MTVTLVNVLLLLSCHYIERLHAFVQLHVDITPRDYHGQQQLHRQQLKSQPPGGSLSYGTSKLSSRLYDTNDSNVGREDDDIMSILSGRDDSDNYKNNDGDIDFSNFNPLSYKASGTKKKKSLLNDYSSGTPISLRKAAMQELTNALFTAVGNEEQTQRILQDYHEFLIEPLEDSQAVLVSLSFWFASTEKWVLLSISSCVEFAFVIRNRHGRRSNIGYSHPQYLFLSWFRLLGSSFLSSHL